MKDFGTLPTRLAAAFGYDIKPTDLDSMSVVETHEDRIRWLLKHLEKHFGVRSPLEKAFLLMFAH